MTTFSGIIPPLATPLKSYDKLDVESVDRLVDHVVEGGVSGVFVLGTTGEGPSLTYPMRYEMVERTCIAADGRVPVLVGITDSSLAESLYLAEHAASCVATAVVAAAPFYFPVDQAGLVDWFQQLADKSPLPVMLYNMPSCVGVQLDLETVVKLSAHPKIVGVKDSSGDLTYFRSLCQHFSQQDDFTVFMGPEELLSEAVAAGADGGVCGGANLLPLVYVDLYDAARRNDQSEVDRLSNIVQRVFEDVYRDPSGQMNLIPALKCALQERGFCDAVTAPPLPPLAAAHEQQIRRRLPELLELAGNLAQTTM